MALSQNHRGLNWVHAVGEIGQHSAGLLVDFGQRQSNRSADGAADLPPVNAAHDEIGALALADPQAKTGHQFVPNFTLIFSIYRPLGEDRSFHDHRLATVLTYQHSGNDDRSFHHHL